MKKYTIICVSFLICGFLWWSEQSTYALELWAQDYEICVLAEYGKTPTQWYSEQGYYPECEI